MTQFPDSLSILGIYLINVSFKEVKTKKNSKLITDEAYSYKIEASVNVYIQLDIVYMKT